MGNVTAKTSGDIASFMTPTETNITSLKVHFSPKQLGEGDPSPDNVREIVGWDSVEVYSAGRNIFPNENGREGILKLKKGTEITASSSEGGYFRGKQNNEFVTPITWLNKTTENGRKYTQPYVLPEDIEKAIVFLANGVSKAQITLDGSVDYEPYQGTTIPIDFTNNYLNKVQITNNKTINSTGEEITESGMSVTDYIPVNENEKWLLQFVSTTAGRIRRIWGYDENKQPISEFAKVSWATVDQEYTLTATITSDIKYIKVCYYTNDTDLLLTIDGTSFKNVYGGYVDLISGELVEEYGKYIFTGNENIQWHGWGDDFYIHDYVTDSSTSLPFKSTDNTYCNMSIPVKNRLVRMPSGNMSVSGTNGLPSHTYIICSSYGFGETLEDCKAKLSELYSNGTPYTVVSELKDIFKKTHQLTPTQLSSFIGQNNFWSNADYVEIEYELKETEDIQKARKKIILNQPHIETVKDDLVNFTTNMKAPLKECKVYFEPIQEGEGGPSPDNVRNINGWDGVSIGLPDEYQEVEYISNSISGSPYINTEIIGKTGLKMTAKLLFTSVINDCCFVGSRSGRDRIYLLHCYQSKFCIGYGDYYSSRTTVEKDVIYDIETALYNGNQYMKINDETVISKTLDTDVNTNYPIYIFGMNYDGNMNYNARGRVYKLQLYDSNVLVRNFIPCYRKLDGEIGMYDTISKQFFTNQGTGTFEKGKDVNTIIGNINWSDEVGTIYGGYVDLVKGELVATHMCETFTSITENVSGQYDNLNESLYFTIIPSYPFVVSNSKGVVQTSSTVYGGLKDGMSNYLKIIYGDNWRGTQYINTIGSNFLINKFSIRISNDLIGATSEDTINERKDKINNYLVSNPLKVVYKLKEPINYQLIPQQLLTFKGENNIWSDTNGQTEVKFWTYYKYKGEKL